MKRLLIILMTLIVLSIAFVYLIIPDTIQLVEIVKIRGNEKAGNRSLMNESDWKKWWPSYSLNGSNDDALRYNNYTYNVRSRYFGSMEMEITKDKKVYSSILRILPLKSDSSVIEWRLIIKSNSNPVSRINNYIEAGRIKRNMKEILKSLTSYLQNVEKVYGINIENETVKDTLLISTTTFTKNYPSVTSIYSSIDSLL